MPHADNTEDTSVSTDTTVNEESVDTSTNEETPDTDTALEDMDISFDDVEDTDESEDSEDETQDTEPAETEEESEEDEQQEEVANPETEEESTASPEDIKKHNAEMAAKRIADKQARDKAKEDQQQKYLEEAEDNRDLAVRQLQIDAYNNKVDRNRNKLDSGIEKAVASIDLFREGTPEVKEELARRLESFEAQFVQYDPYGEPIEVKGDVYEYLQNEADSIRRLISTGARNQSKAKTKAKARTETLPTRAPKEPKVDPDLAAFDEEVAKWE